MLHKGWNTRECVLIIMGYLWYKLHFLPHITHIIHLFLPLLLSHILALIHFWKSEVQNQHPDVHCFALMCSRMHVNQSTFTFTLPPSFPLLLVQNTSTSLRQKLKVVVCYFSADLKEEGEREGVVEMTPPPLLQMRKTQCEPLQHQADIII